jgi:hypothetical protein
VKQAFMFASIALDLVRGGRVHRAIFAARRYRLTPKNVAELTDLS